MSTAVRHDRQAWPQSAVPHPGMTAGLPALPLRRRTACAVSMRMRWTAGRALALAVAVAAVVLAGCGGRSGEMGSAPAPGHGYHFSSLTCTAPADLPGSTVTVTLADMGMTQMMSGRAPLGVHMMLRAAPLTVPAGRVSLVAENRGLRTHELVILPMSAGEQAGQRIPGPDGTVSEKGSLGEASASCGPGAGEGIRAGTAGWVTLTLAPGRYELLCNLPNHYADGMYAELQVTSP